MATRPSAGTAAERPKFTELNNLLSGQAGAEVLFATDDWFAAAECLLKDHEAEWKEGVFDDFGKWMDGWETRRKRIPGHDWCIIKLAYPGIIHGVDIDTAWFTGNFVPKASIQAANLEVLPSGFKSNRNPENGKAATEEDFENAALLKSENWDTIVEKRPLGAGYSDTCHNYVPVGSRKTYTHIRLNMFPDGGIARLRVYGQVQRSLKDIQLRSQLLSCDKFQDLIDLVAMENGGMCLGYTDAHYGHPRNIILKTEPLNMGGGWETARRLDRPEVLELNKAGVLQVGGCEQCVFRLGLAGTIRKVQIDTTFFKGNFPAWGKVEGLVSSGNGPENMDQLRDWTTILPETKLGANQKHFFNVENLKKITHVRLTMGPDGGIARFRAWGQV